MGFFTVQGPRFIVRSAAVVDEGWTTFTATEPSGEGSGFSGAGTRKIYVSSSTGSDSNTGTEASPKATISAGKGLLRNNKPDWLLLKRGDTWTGVSFGQITNSGVSSTEPQLIGAYGTGARPLVKTPIETDPIYWSGGTSAGSNTAVVSIELYCYTRNPADPGYVTPTTAHYAPYAMVCFSPITWLLVEDCKFSFYANGPSFLGNRQAVMKFRRNVSTDMFNIDSVGHSQGAYFDGIDDLLIEENLFDHNGWVVGGPSGTGPTVFNHNWYIQSTEFGFGVDPIVLRGNISLNDSASTQTRAGGTHTNNFFYNTDVLTNAKFDVFTSSNNVFTVGSQIGLDVSHVVGETVAGSVVTNNIFANGSGGVALKLTPNFSTGITISNNVIFNWPDDYQNEASHTFTGNQVDLNGDNTEFSFPNPTIDLGDYAGSIGLTATIAAFIAAARANRKDSWDVRLTAPYVNNYWRAAFGKAAV